MSSPEKIPAISVVVTVYNVEKYLRQCIDSILNQTFSDFELICVNDGSTDASLEILEQYAATDNRIKIVTQQNAGVGMARNTGLDNACGKYVLFLDADDFFECSMLEKNYEKAEETDADIVIFRFKKFDDITQIMNPWSEGIDFSIVKYLGVFSRKDIPEQIMQITMPNQWTKFYKRSFLQKTGIRFPSYNNSEDEYFTYLSICLAERISWLDYGYVRYRINRSDSLDFNQVNHSLCCIEADKALFDELNRRGIFKEVERSYANRINDHYNFLLNKFRDNPAVLDGLKAELKNDLFPYTKVLEHPDNYFYNVERVQNLRSIVQ